MMNNVNLISFIGIRFDTCMREHKGCILYYVVSVNTDTAATSFDSTILGQIKRNMKNAQCYEWNFDSRYDEPTHTESRIFTFIVTLDEPLRV